MSLAAGTRLGVYEIVGAIGAGGMGEVYRARDTKLNRDVAIKILPDAFATDPERLGRFRREAQVLASLNHPNIAAIYGFEDSPKTHALVLELVEGPTLAEMIAERAAQGADGPGIPLAESLRIARQLAAALEAAHDLGIVHRDLKPANIKIKDDGTVKVLDFGLAKALAPDADPQGSVSNSPTLTARATQLGMILGTAAYMAPEQAKGRSVDRRADIWAFGVVLFEMLTGRRAFDGDDVSDVLASVLKTEPDWTKLPADLPAPMRRLLGRCLEKDPRRRLRDIGEGMLQLDDGLSFPAMPVPAGMSSPAMPVSTPGGSPVARPAWWRRALPIAATALATAGVMSGVWFLLKPAPAQPGVVRFDYLPRAEAAPATTATHPDVAISPDGHTLVHVAQLGSGMQLYVRRMDQLDSVALRGADVAVGPFFSPDGQWLGFVESGSTSRVKKVGILGGPPTVVAQLRTAAFGAAWLTDGTIVLGAAEGGLLRVSENGGEAAALTTMDAAQGDTTHRWPSVVPGTSLVLFAGAASGGFSTAFIGVVDVKTGKTTRLKLSGSMPHYLGSGHLVFVTAEGALRAVPFDIDRLEVRGSAVPLVEGIGVKPNGAANFALAGNGTLVYTHGFGLLSNRSIVWVDRAGRETPIQAPPRNYYYARVSPNGVRLSLDIRDQELDVWIWDDRALMRLTADREQDQYGLWTPDSQQLVIQSARSQKAGLYVVRADGVGTPRLIAERATAFPNAVTPDGKSVIFRASTTGKNDLFIVPLDGTGQAKTLLATEHDELNAAISPDGKWMAYQSDLQGRMDIWVRPFPNVNDGQVLVSTGGGSEPVWGRTGELYYLSTDNKIMAVEMSPGRELAPKTPTMLFDASPYFFGGLGRNYDVSPDGKRFVMVKNPSGQTGSNPLTVVLNWATELTRVK
jgi:serine/threonine-protein kinase